MAYADYNKFLCFIYAINLSCIGIDNKKRESYQNFLFFYLLFIFSSSIFGFVLWMIGTSLLLFVVAVLFLRVQVRSISQLAAAAEDFGKGVNTKFKPYGSIEVRRAGLAFTKMKERIMRQISEKTQMLAGVSHDLRTPLTRMKLQMAMLPDSKENQEFIQDINEMEKMLDGYLSYVSGEGGEKSSFVDVDRKSVV